MSHAPTRPRTARAPAAVLCLLLAAVPSAAGDKREAPRPVKHQVTGLFMKERAQDLREAVEKLPQIKLVSTDFENAEATFAYDVAQAFPGAKPEQVVERFDKLLRAASGHTLGIKPLRSVPLEKLKRL